ncbi:MAG: NFACT RNA binding domain-containing protein [Clostridia bacterium]|nr:NFACT RNA binding domain-containing protein [Clostridia bacterium]
MDGLTLYAMVQELKPLLGARVDKVQQPDSETLLITFRHRKLLINIHNANGRVQLTNSAFENPASAPAFCMLLRKHLLNAKLIDVFSEGLDRIAVFVFQGRNELLDETELRLVVELMGRHGNAFLLDSGGKILDCMRHFGLDESAIRLCMPNAQYQNPPAQQKLDPFTTELAAVLPCELSAVFMGISKPLAKVLPTDADSLQALFLQLSAGIVRPALYPFGVAPFQLPGGEPYPSLSEAMDAYFIRRDIELRMQRQSSSLKAITNHAISRCSNRLSDAFAALQNEETVRQCRLFGELITANLHAIVKGERLALLDNYYEQPPSKVEVPLDPSLSPGENAAKYFKKYRKAKAAHDYAKSRLADLELELKTLESVRQSLDVCTTSAELAEVAEELFELGYIKKQAVKRNAKAVATKPLQFESRSGVKIEAGKNNRQNDRLLRETPPDEIWLHAKDIPSSHVILHSTTPSEEDLLDAARIAACYCKAKLSDRVPVDYTRRRYVKKPNGAPPGFVIYTNQRTLFVKPDEKAVKELLR